MRDLAYLAYLGVSASWLASFLRLHDLCDLLKLVEAFCCLVFVSHILRLLSYFNALF